MLSLARWASCTWKVFHRKLLIQSSFDSNYHIVKVDHSPSTHFKLLFNQALEEYKEAKELGVITRPVMFGPITYLSLVRKARDAPADFEPLQLLSSRKLVWSTSNSTSLFL